MGFLAEACSRDALSIINWLALALPIGGISGVISSLKGKGFWHGFVLGSLMLIIGLIIVAVEDSEKE